MTDSTSNLTEYHVPSTQIEDTQQKDQDNDIKSDQQQANTNGSEAETSILEELSIDDTLPLIDRVIKYCTSSIALQRLVHVKMLGDAALYGGYERTRDDIIPELSTIANDNEWVVRQHLGEQLAMIAKVCIEHGGDVGYHTNIESILPLVKTLLVDHQEEVRLATGVSLVSIAEMMSPVDRGAHILTMVLHLAHNDEAEQLRITAAQLLNSLVVVLGHDLCKQFITPEMVALAEDPVFRVRKAAAFNMDKICLVAGEQDVTERLLPAYIRLTKDDIYRVRKACAESLVDLSKAINSDLRSHIIAEMFLRLSADTNKFVRNTILQQLGPFIATLSSNEIGHDLLELYISMATYTSGDITVDNNIRFWCAYNLPAVVLTLGPQRWEDIRHCFNVLFKDKSIEVRRTLACSLHEIAKIVSQINKAGKKKKSIEHENNDEDIEVDVDYMKEDILPKFEFFLVDNTEIRSGVLRHLAEFLFCLEFETRQKYIYILQEMVGIVSTTHVENFELLVEDKDDSVKYGSIQNNSNSENSEFNDIGESGIQNDNKDNDKVDGEITTKGTTTKKETNIGGGGEGGQQMKKLSSPDLSPQLGRNSFGTFALSQGGESDTFINNKDTSKYLNNVDENDWRAREQLAEQLTSLVTLFRKEYCMNIIAPIIFELLQDNTHIVRKASFPALVSLMEVMGSDNVENDSKIEDEYKNDDKPQIQEEKKATLAEEDTTGLKTNVQDDEVKNENFRIDEENRTNVNAYQDFIIKQFVTLAQHDSFYRRQDFINVSFLLAGSSKFGTTKFIEKILPYLLPLSIDPVSNTRIVLSRNLVEKCPDWLFQSSTFRRQLLKPLVEEGNDAIEIRENILLLKHKYPHFLEPLLIGHEETLSHQEEVDISDKESVDESLFTKTNRDSNGDERGNDNYDSDMEYYPRAGRRLSEGSHSHHEIEVDVLPEEIADQETALRINSPFSYTQDEEFMDMDAVLEEKLRLSLDKEHIQNLVEQGEGEGPPNVDVVVEREESLQDVEEREAKLKEIEEKLTHSHDDIDEGEQNVSSTQGEKEAKSKSVKVNTLPRLEELPGEDQISKLSNITSGLQQVRLGVVEEDL